MLTKHQEKVWELYQELGSSVKVAKKLNVTRQATDKTIKVIKVKFAKKGIVGDKDNSAHVGEGYMVKGTSTLVDSDGNAKLTWVKTTADLERQHDAMMAAIDVMSKDIKRVSAVKRPKMQNKSLLNCYTITDYHLGMLSWKEETGGTWDLKKAENMLVSWFEQAIATSPNANDAVFAQLGDFMHWDGLDAVTPMNKHVLDADSRFQKLVRVAIRVLRRVIDMLLHKHQTVSVIFAEGNHDLASSVWLREMFNTLYENEPRVTVDVNPDPYYCHEFGNTSLFFHHGHKKAKTAISDVFVAKFREVFGRTKHSYGHMGHLHHNWVREDNLMTIEQHRTLASPDAYAARGGWMSGREAKVITYHKEFGEVSRVTISDKMV